MDDLVEVAFDLTPPTDDQLGRLASVLSVEERHLLLDHGEEAPFCGIFLSEKREPIRLPVHVRVSEQR